MKKWAQKFVVKNEWWVVKLLLIRWFLPRWSIWIAVQWRKFIVVTWWLHSNADKVMISKSKSSSRFLSSSSSPSPLASIRKKRQRKISLFNLLYSFNNCNGNATWIYVSPSDTVMGCFWLFFLCFSGTFIDFYMRLCANLQGYRW